MLTLRRVLKYTPAVVLGLLVVAWVVSWFLSIKVVTHDRANFAFRFVGSSLYILWDVSDFGERLPSVSRHEFQLPDSLLGRCDYASLVFVSGGGLSYVGLGIPAMATVLLPSPSARSSLSASASGKISHTRR
jgi:hypothetical protein